jgi:magnesium transporter
MDAVVDRYFPVLDGLEEDLDELEDAIFGGRAERQTTERIYDRKRDVISLKRAVSPLIDVCNRLVRYDQGLITDECRPYFRDVYDHHPLNRPSTTCAVLSSALGRTSRHVDPAERS